MTIVPKDGRFPNSRLQLGDQLILFASKMARVQEHVLERSPSELSYRPFRMMRRITEGKNTITKIGEGSTITYSALSQSLRKLLELRYVVQNQDSVDGRDMKLIITGRGAQALEEAQGILNAYCEEILKSLTDEQCERMSEGFRTILANLDAYAEGMGLRPAARARMARPSKPAGARPGKRPDSVHG
jgi:DNA-binding MarR family transcriptional regulator